MRRILKTCALVACGLAFGCGDAPGPQPQLLKGEDVSGKGVWVDPVIANFKGRQPTVPVKVWFDRQFLGDGAAWRRRAGELAGSRRRELRPRVIACLKELAEESRRKAGPALEKLVDSGDVSGVRWHWIINGVSLRVKKDGLDKLKAVPGVKKVFFDRYGNMRARPTPDLDIPSRADSKPRDFDIHATRYPWYIHYLQADRVWKSFGIKGRGITNVIHDFNFMWTPTITGNAYRNPGEIPGNGKDDDGNGLVDDVHGFNFSAGNAQLNPSRQANQQSLHGHNCAAIICSPGQENNDMSLGIAPESQWAGIIGANRIEEAVEWAVMNNADTYSMSFSQPNLGEFRSHWRKIMEHGSFCGIYFVSGAGNFGNQRARNFAPVPVQMRVPEDIPDAVFAAAGIGRDFSKTEFSSKGPVKWDNDHYSEGLVQKPLVCAFNRAIPFIQPNGKVNLKGTNGNSFAGPMFCGSISLILCADPDLCPWDLKEIITSTATDVSKKGVDYETGYGLINCYRAVRETLRRKAVREGRDPKPFEGREDGDVFTAEDARADLKKPALRKFDDFGN